MLKKIKSNLAAQIFIALVLAIVVGLLFGKNPAFAVSYIKPIGTIFLNLLKFIVCPIVLFSILAGMISMKDIKKVGSIGLKTIAYYLLTTAVAIVIGLVMGQLFKGVFPALATTDLVYEAKEATPFMNVLVDIFPSNFLAPLVNANMLQIIVIAILLGFGIILLGDKVAELRNLLEQINEVFMKVMELILKLSPIGVFCLLTPVVAENGAKIIGSLTMVLVTAYISYILHAVIVYSTTVRTMGGLSPWKFFKDMAPAMIFAFSSASSVGTLPLTLECSEKLGADKEVASFVLPLGATINMDGNCMCLTVISLFFARICDVALGTNEIIVLLLLVLILSLGAPIAPGTLILCLVTLLTQMGIDISVISLVIGINFILEMLLGMVNSVGDVVVALLVARKEGTLDLDTYRKE
mgnify:CR=1 FL=1